MQDSSVMAKENFYIMSKELERAVKNGEKIVASEIIRKLDHINCCDFGTKTSLVMWSCAWGWTDLLIFLIEKGAVFKSYCSLGGDTALMTAASHGRIDIVEILVNRGAKVNQKDVSGNTAAHYAAFSKNWKILRLLIENGSKYKLIVPIDVDWEQIVSEDPDIPQN